MVALGGLADSHIESNYHQPSLSELADRLSRLCETLYSNDLNYYVVTCPNNVFYLTNFANYVHERPFILIISRSGIMRFLVPKLEVPHVACRAIGDIELVSYEEFPAPEGARWIDRFRTLVRPGSKVGIESICPHYVSSAVVGNVRAIDLVEDLRMIKSDYELARIQYASELATGAHTAFLKNAAVGRTMLEASSETSSQIMGRLLADEPSLNIFATKFTLVFQPPSISQDPHNFTDLKVAMENGGPHVSIVNGVMNGYGTEVERTFFLGSIPEAAKRPFETMLEARRTALERVRPGVLMSEVDKAANDVFHKAGYGDRTLHRAGHGIGVTGHEGPFFADGYDREILPRMVFTMEPGIYLPGIGGFRHSDTLYISDDGPIIMTDGPVEIDDLLLGNH